MADGDRRGGPSEAGRRARAGQHPGVHPGPGGAGATAAARGHAAGGPAGATARSGSPAARQGQKPASSRWGRYLVLAALLLAVIGGIAYAVEAGTRRGHASAASSPPHAGGSGAAAPPRSRRPSTGSSQQGHQHVQQPVGSGPGKAGFLRTYYSTVPEDLDTGWTLLGPHEKSVGRASYDQFWGSMASVDVSHIVTSPGSRSADITLTYHYKDGRVVEERQRVTLVRAADGHSRIDNDQVLSSRTR